MRPEREGSRGGGCKSAAFRKGMGEKTAREERGTLKGGRRSRLRRHDNTMGV